MFVEIALMYSYVDESRKVCTGWGVFEYTCMFRIEKLMGWYVAVNLDLLVEDNLKKDQLRHGGKCHYFASRELYEVL
jgi:hypothetical protein